MNACDELLLTAICALQVARHRSNQLQKQLVRRGTDKSDQLQQQLARRDTDQSGQVQKQLARRGTDPSDQLQKQLARRGIDLLPMYDEMITAQQDLAALQGIHHTSMKASLRPLCS